MDKFGLSGSQISRTDIFQLLVRVSFASVITYYTAKWMMKQLDPTSKNMRKAKIRAQEQLKRLCDQGDFKIDSEKFSDYELMIASHLVVPSDISVSWKDIAGLDSIIQDLRESVVLPVRHRHLFQQSKLWHPPKGVLLHGPPGCGKTLIAKATAKDAGMRFINLDVSVLTDKWYGESQKLASAVFSLALKVQPCIIFIDEIDSFLRSRNTNDHEATAMMKTQFMMLWDGLSTNCEATVMVMGATNRPQDLDKAIIRRMPAQFHIGLPNMEQRHQILKLILDNEVHNNIDYVKLSKLTNGFSGSDLREMCRNASVLRMRHYMRSNLVPASNVEFGISITKNDLMAEDNCDGLMIICMEDLISSFEKIQESKVHTGQLLMEHRIDLD